MYAPFDGVITARNTDIGDLINSGSSTAPKTDLFHMAQTDTLRVYVNVPEEYSRGIKPGETAADIVLAEFPGQKFPGKTGAHFGGNQRAPRARCWWRSIFLIRRILCSPVLMQKYT